MRKDPSYLDEAFEEICAELTDLFVKKHHDYGKENILEIEELGIAFRIQEKLSRIKNLKMKNKAPENESLDDSWRDIAVYAIIALLYRRGWFQRLEMEKQSKV